MSADNRVRWAGACPSLWVALVFWLVIWGLQ